MNDVEAEMISRITQRQRAIEQEILENFNGKDILNEIADRKMDATKYVASGKGTNEEIEKELKL